jgi:Domain of unknown function (DUF4388)
MNARASGDRRPPSSSRGSGFQAHIKGASLADLFQMECLSGSRRVVNVTSDAGVGFFYFRSGSLVHATTRALIGEPAALEILGWREGSFEPVEREWPAHESISCSWQSLLLRAAQISDENEAQSLIAFPAESHTERNSTADLAVESIELEATPLEIGGHTLRAEDFDVIVRLSPIGAVIFNRGSTDEFADILAYACRLTELIGQMLAMDRFVAMECSFKRSRCFVVLGDTGEVVAVKPRATTDLNALRELLGT